jgi:hypothetical protein
MIKGMCVEEKEYRQLFRELMSELHYFLGTKNWATFPLTKYRGSYLTCGAKRHFRFLIRMKYIDNQGNT